MRALIAASFALWLAACTHSNPGANCGALGSACCADGTCKSGGACVANVCQQCGDPGQACCAGVCTPGNTCANDTCQQCGGPGQPCCAGNACANGGCCVNRICTASGSACPSVGMTCSNGSCGTCGAVGQACCTETQPPGRTTCTATGAACSAANQCVACGGAGQPCCSGNSCTASGYACGDTMTCEQCGGAGQVCCAGQACSGSGLACSDNLCKACGAPGEACCTNGDCGNGCCDPGTRLCVAGGQVCTTGGACANNVCPPLQPGSMCNPTQTFMTFDKTCTAGVADACALGFHQIDCCGSLDAIGINRSQRDAFNQAEQTWDRTCPMCACPPAPVKAEDGKSCAMNQVTVSCDTGMCTSHCP